MCGAPGGASCAESREYFIAGDRFDLPAFQIVDPPVQRLPRKCEFIEKGTHHVPDQFVTSASGIAGHVPNSVL
jgi:hypothetical protein